MKEIPKEVKALNLARKRAEDRLRAIGVIDGGILAGRLTTVVEDNQEWVIDGMRPFLEAICDRFADLGLEFCVWSRTSTGMDFWLLSKDEIHEDLIGEQVSHLLLFWKYQLVPETRLWMLAVLLGLLSPDEIPKVNNCTDD